MGCSTSSPSQEDLPLTIGGAGDIAPQTQANSTTSSSEVQLATDDSFAVYYDYEELLRTVESGAIAPLKGSYVLELYERGGRIKRRQEMTAEAFWTAAELRAIVEAARRHFGDDREAARAALGHLFNALSYRWLAKGQPDPDGFHLERVANFLYSYLGRGNPKCRDFEQLKSTYLNTTPLQCLFEPLGLSSPDCAIFWDFAVLWQKALPDANGEQEDDRTDEQRAQFGEGLGASNVWYGHAHALTWVQRDLPDGFVGTTYDGSGWCFVEASLSAALKRGPRRVDIGKFTADELFYPNVPYAIGNCAKGTRPPPRHPSSVAKMLESKSFFAKSIDLPKVAALYRDFFETVAPRQRELLLSGLEWGDEEVVELAGALPSFVALESLDLSHNKIRDEGGKALAAYVVASGSLTSLDLSSNQLEAEAAKALAPALAANAVLTSLNLSWNGLGPKGAAALAAGLAANASLTKILVGGNGLRNEGTTILCDALRESTVNKVEELDLRSNSIGPDGTKAIAALCAVRGSLTSLTLSYNSLKDEGVGAICEAIKSNKETKIAVLEIAGNSLSPAGAESVAAMAAVTGSLTEVNIDGFALPIKQLKGTEPAESLDFSGKRLGPASAIVIASLIGANGSLTECKLCGNELGVEGWTIIFNALCDSPSSKITTWDLSNEDLGPEIAKPLAEYISVSGSLTSLDVTHNQLGEEGRAMVSDAVKGCEGFTLKL